MIMQLKLQKAHIDGSTLKTALALDLLTESDFDKWVIRLK